MGMRLLKLGAGLPTTPHALYPNLGWPGIPMPGMLRENASPVCACRARSMLALMWPFLASAASVGCAFAALGLALYADGDARSAATLFASVGAATGLACAPLDLAWRRLPPPRQTAGAEPLNKATP